MSRLDYERYIMRKSGVAFGENVCVYDSYIDPAFGFLITIGNNVTITNSKVYAHDASTHIFMGKSKVGKIKIGNNVFIGANSVIMPNVTIGDSVIIGAGSIISRDIPANSIVAGNPARLIGNTDQFIRKHTAAMRTHPVWDVYWQNKTDEDKKEMCVALENNWGYDE